MSNRCRRQGDAGTRRRGDRRVAPSPRLRVGLFGRGTVRPRATPTLPSPFQGEGLGEGDLDKIGNERRLGDRGMTLVELMFGVVITLVLVGAGYTVMTGSEKAASVNDQTAQMQQNGRIAMEVLARDLKMAGFGMIGPVAACNNAVVPTDNNLGGADTGPDSVSLVVPAVLSTLRATVTGGPTVNTIQLQTGDVAVAGFTANQPISVGGTVSATATGVAGDTLTLLNPIGAPAVFPGCVQPCTGATLVYWLQCVAYTINTNAVACSGNPPCLMRGGVPVAEGIEDLQVAYACDGCTGTGIPDGIVDDQNASGTFDAADFMSNNNWLTSPMTPDRIRLVRVSIVARQPRTDVGMGERTTRGSMSAPVVAEDHNPATDPGFNATTYAQERRRLLTRTIQVRNLGL